MVGRSRVNEPSLVVSTEDSVAHMTAPRGRPLLAPNGLELSRLASPGLVSHEIQGSGLAGSAPASC